MKATSDDTTFWSELKSFRNSREMQTHVFVTLQVPPNCKQWTMNNFDCHNNCNRSYPRYLTWCWTRAMSKTLGILFSFGLMQRTKWQFLFERVLRRAPSDTLNWVPTVAGRLRMVLLELPENSNQSEQSTEKQAGWGSINLSTSSGKTLSLCY